MWFRRYCPDKHSLTFWTCCDLDLQPSNPIFQQDTLAYDAVLANQVWLQMDPQFRRYSKNSHILIIYVLAVTLTLKIVNQFFCMTHHLIHCHTKFSIKNKKTMDEPFRRYWADTIGNMEKISSGQTFTDILNFAETLTLNAELAFFNRTLWLMMLYHQTKFGCKLTSSLENIAKIVIFWLYYPSLWPWYWR